MADYRYILHRETGVLGGNGHGIFVMLNPSTADETTDDPTIRRCKGFSAREGWARFSVVNLFPARATKPADLIAMHRRGEDIVGPKGDEILGLTLRPGSTVVAAWGASGGALADERAKAVSAAFMDIEWWCLGTTDSGRPRHPLYVRADEPLVRWMNGKAR